MLEVRSTLLRIRPGGLWSLVSGAGIVAAIPLGLRGLASPLLLLFTVVALVPALSRWAYSLPRRHTRIEVQRNHVRLVLDGGERDVTLADVVGAHAEDDRTVMLLLRSGTSIRAELDGARADDVLHAFGFDRAQRALTAPLRGTLGPLTRGLLALVVALLLTVPLGLVALGGEAGTAFGFGVALVLAAQVVARCGRPQVVLGTDGVRLTGGVIRRFIPFSAIERASAVTVSLPAGTDDCYVRDLPGWGVRLLLRHGKSVHLPTIGQTAAQQGALLSRIRAGLHEYGAEGSRRALRAASGVDELAPNGRSVAQWTRELADWRIRDAGFRDQPVGEDELRQVLSDASAPLPRRVGAALALKASEPDALPRIRLAADTSASDEARNALEAVHDDTLDDALLQRIVRS